MRDTVHGEDHAVAAARLDGRWLTLDNRRMAMVEDALCPELPAACSSSTNTGSSDTPIRPLLAVAPDRDPAPSVALNLAVPPGLISISN